MIKKILNLIYGFSKVEIFFIIIFILIGSIFEILSLGIIIPLISFFTDSPENSFIIKYLENFLSIKLTNRQIILLLISFILLVFASRFIFLSFLTIKINTFIFGCQKLISEKLLKIFMNKNYSWHTENNKSYFINLMTTEVFNFCQNGLSGFLFLCAELIFFLGIVFFLVIWEPKIFIIIFIISILFFPILLSFTRKVSFKLGSTRQKMESNILITINENLNGIKEMLLYNWSMPLQKSYSELASKLVKVSAKHNSMQDISRYLIELCGVLLVIIFIYFLTISKENQESLITIGIFGAAVFRLMPILNRISTYSQRLKFGTASLDKINEFLEDKKYEIQKLQNAIFKDKIIFKDISFKFKNKSEYIIKNLNFELNRNEILGIHGESGVGKTTLSNIIMGLINPTSGQILVDGIDIIDKKQSLQKSIAFVPQNFFYTDASLLNNITFFEKNINFNNLKFAIKKSLLVKPIIDRSLSLKTNIGNNALKISGGQLQRINLARALYRQPRILVLDEPTSALDKNNQDQFKEILQELKSKMTIIVISHNMEILDNCDKLIKLEK